MATNSQPQITPGQREYMNSVTPPKKPQNKQMSTQTHLQFSEIRDGVVVMRDSSLRMIILCSPTNFDLKSPAEKDAIEFAFQGFLNGLHFPIQIVVQSRRIDLDAYLEKLEKIQSDQPNPLLGSLMEDYIYNIRGLLDEVNIMEKRFFVVVPYYVGGVSKENIATKLRTVFKGNAEVTQTSTEYEARKKELVLRTNQVAQGLAQVGVRSVILNTQEVIELFYNSYNIEEAQNQSLGDVSQMNAPAVSRTGGPATLHPPQAPEPAPDDLFSAAQKQTQAATQPTPLPNQQPPAGGAR
jgi:hypothetical protein